MRGKTRLFGVFGAAVLMCALLLTGALAAQGPEAGEATVLFTHDLHSCFFPRAQEGGGELGGFARLSYDTAAPAIGYTALSADGKGGVQSDEDGRSYWVVEQDAAAKTVTVLL